MKLIVLFLSAICLSHFGFATNLPASTKNYQTLDLKQFDGLKDQSTMKVKVGMSCKSESGLEYKVGDVGYEQCVKHSATKTGQQNKDLKTQNNGPNSTGTMEVTF